MTGDYDVSYAQTSPPTTVHEGSLNLSHGEFGDSGMFSGRWGFRAVSSFD